MHSEEIRHEVKKVLNEKPKLKVLAYGVFLSALCIIVIKTIIRPKHFHFSDHFDFLQGTLPNFFAGVMVYSLAYLFFSAFSKGRVPTVRIMIYAFMISFLGLALWEYLQYFMGFPIDGYDIMMTAIGNICVMVIMFLFRIK